MQKTDASTKNEAETMLHETQRRDYLKRHGVMQGKPVQLDLLCKERMVGRNDLRHMPNDYGRSSLFTVGNRKTPRRNFFDEPLFHYNDHILITYTGVELRAEDDEIVWLQILHYAQEKPLGSYVDFYLKDLVSDLGLPRSGASYNQVRESILRLSANTIQAVNSRAYGTSGSIRLIASYEFNNDGMGKIKQYRVKLDPKLTAMFAGNNFTSHRWLDYRNLSPSARRLADYTESHETPHPLDVNRFQRMCGSFTHRRLDWRKTVIKAGNELVEKGFLANFALANDKIITQKPVRNANGS